ncbi:hypothetical protein D3C87_1619880 [compost metagenome]
MECLLNSVPRFAADPSPVPSNQNLEAVVFASRLFQFPVSALTKILIYDLKQRKRGRPGLLRFVRNER